MFTWHSNNMNSAPAGLQPEFTRPIHVNELIGDQMNVKTVLLAQLKDTQPL